MQGLLLISCTFGNSTIIHTDTVISPTLIPYLTGFNVIVTEYPGVCFNVKQYDNRICSYSDITKEVVTFDNTCNSEIGSICRQYLLTPCNNTLIEPFNVAGGATNNLYPYVLLNKTITCYEYPGTCFTITCTEEIDPSATLVLTCVQECSCSLYNEVIFRS